MALYELTGNGLVSIAQSTFTALGLRERANIQQAVRKNIRAITPGVETMVLAEEYGDWIDANRRIDLLCLDDDGCLVVVELKRDNSAHMELQALRYAAMVSAMRFEQAVEAHRRYLKSIDSDADPEQSLKDFLEAGSLSGKVRIVLASSDFSVELTTAVLWLNAQGIDIRCVQLRPHPVDDRILLDIHQVIPLPQAQQYQVALREKAMEQEAIREQTRDTTRYDLTLADVTLTNLPKRRLIYEVVAEAVRRGVSPERIATAVPWRESRMFVCADGFHDGDGLRTALGGRPLDRYYDTKKDLFHVGGKTYAFSTQWGARTLEAIENILPLMPAGHPLEFMPTTAVVDEASYDGYLIRQRQSGSIELELNGEPVQPVKPVLRELASKLSISTLNENGNDTNTRQLGARIIRAISSLE